MLGQVCRCLPLKNPFGTAYMLGCGLSFSRCLRKGAKLTKAELDVGELEKLITAEMTQRNSYCDADGIRGAFLAGEADRIAPLIAY